MDNVGLAWVRLGLGWFLGIHGKALTGEGHSRMRISGDGVAWRTKLRSDKSGVYNLYNISPARVAIGRARVYTTSETIAYIGLMCYSSKLLGISPLFV